MIATRRSVRIAGAVSFMTQGDAPGRVRGSKLLCGARRRGGARKRNFYRWAESRRSLRLGDGLQALASNEEFSRHLLGEMEIKIAEHAVADGSIDAFIARESVIEANP